MEMQFIMKRKTLGNRVDKESFTKFIDMNT